MAARATTGLAFSGNLDAGLPEKATLSTGTVGAANAQAVGVQDDLAGNSLTITAENAAAGAVGNDVTIDWVQDDTALTPTAVYTAANRTITVTADFDNSVNVTYNDIAGVISTLGDFSALVIGNGALNVDLAGGAIGDGNTVADPGLFAGGSDALDDIAWTAIAPGTGGNNIEVVYQLAPAAGNPTAVNVIGNQVVVSLGRDGNGFVNADAADVINAVNTDAVAGALIRGSTSGAGTGTVQPMAAQNLAGGGASVYTYEYYLYDSLGERYDVDLTFTGIGQNTWEYDLEVTDEEGNQVPLAAGANGILVFDTAGAMDEDASVTPNIVFNPPGADQIDVEPQFGTITQLSGMSTLLVRSQDGYAAGELIAFSITRTGEIIGTYTNGLFDGLGQIAMSYFTNPEGLQNDGGNLFQETVNSGEARFGLPGTESRGMIMSSALELSNVDLAFEFTELITTSRGFQAGTRVVTTSDEVLVEVINMKR